MYRIKQNQVYASEIAEFLNTELSGEDFIVTEPCSVIDAKPNALTFIFNKQFLDRRKDVRPLLVICPPDLRSEQLPFSVIFSKNPKVDFIKVINEFFIEKLPHKIHPTAVIEKGARIGENVGIGSHSFIGPDVRIGKDTLIGCNVVITGTVSIGKNCVIKDNATIGSEAFSFWYDESGVPIHFPQVGKIVIGDYVWIGSNSTVERQALGETVIENHVKVDDLVQIGHGAVIGEKSQVCAASVVCGSVRVGKHSWIAPNATIREGLTVGERSLVGIGSVVIRDVPDHTIVAGNPAKPLEKRNFPEGLYGWTD
jgi:UDP-3-O-[3-hydroxymyristoyl] glucosamine N-acyltransferase